VNEAELNELFRAFEAGDFNDDSDGSDGSDGSGGAGAGPLSAEERVRLATIVPQIRTATEAPLPLPGLRSTVLALVRAQAETDTSAARTTRLDEVRAQRRRRPVTALVAVGAAAAGIVATLLINRPATTRSVELAGGKFRVVATDVAPTGEGEAEILRRRTGDVMKLAAEGLAATDASHVYQVWCVATTDTAEVPSRIAVGTFRTVNGTVHVEFPIGVDWAKYPTVAITLEPEDGDPRQTGPTVLDAALEPPAGPTGKPA
jgi:hypothetical protein